MLVKFIAVTVLLKQTRGILFCLVQKGLFLPLGFCPMKCLVKTTDATKHGELNTACNYHNLQSVTLTSLLLSENGHDLTRLLLVQTKKKK